MGPRVDDDLEALSSSLVENASFSATSFARAFAIESAECERIKIARSASLQLHQELLDSIIHDQERKVDGVALSPLYRKLPAEVRLHIFSYLVTCEESIHLHSAKGNANLGFRLSRCGDHMLNMNSGNCNCERASSVPLRHI